MSRRIPSGTGFAVPSTGHTLMTELTTDIGSSKSPRVIVPLLHIYLEQVLELLLKKLGQNLIIYYKDDQVIYKNFNWSTL